MEPPLRQKIPKDGPGPRGYPDCYYTSRVLNSTGRYARFVNKLRHNEEETRRGRANELKELKDKQTSDFFIRCDRRSLINTVARRVDLCLDSYEKDLNAKRRRLITLLQAEEEENIRKFVAQAQAGAEALWQEKKERLAYLLAKRKKEHEEKYKDTPLSKSPHVLACITKIRAKETADIQLYQMREKEAMKMAEKELNNMWHEVAMKESEALAARMEYDEIERLRRDKECKKYTDYQIEMKRQQREKERELLKQEALMMQNRFDKDAKKEDEAERQKQEKRIQLARERKQMLVERQEVLTQQAAKDKLIADTWDSLANERMSDERYKEELKRKTQMELNHCNQQMVELKKEFANMDVLSDAFVEQEARRIQDERDKRRCEYVAKTELAQKALHESIISQIKQKEELRQQQLAEQQQQNEYHKQLFAQTQQLVELKMMTNKQAKKAYENKLLEQIQYNNVLKERARQEELEQRKKGEKAKEEYEAELKRMLCRPFFSDEIHPFMKQMAKGLHMKEQCPCTKPTYCDDHRDVQAM